MGREGGRTRETGRNTERSRATGNAEEADESRRDKLGHIKTEQGRQRENRAHRDQRR